MGFFTDLLVNIGVMDRPKMLRKTDRRKKSRRWERTTVYKNSPEYQSRMKRDRRRGDRRK
jgi:hypothetical protein